MNPKLRKLVEHVVHNPKAVTLDELVQVCSALGGSQKPTKSGGQLRIPGKVIWTYHKPHGKDSKFVKPGAVAEFIRCADLEGLLAESEEDDGEV